MEVNSFTNNNSDIVDGNWR